MTETIGWLIFSGLAFCYLGYIIYSEYQDYKLIKESEEAIKEGRQMIKEQIARAYEQLDKKDGL